MKKGVDGNRIACKSSHVSEINRKPDTTMKMTIEHDNASVARSLSQSAMHEEIAPFAKGQPVKVFDNFNGIVKSIGKNINGDYYAWVKMLDWGTEEFLPASQLKVNWKFEMKWIESLLDSQRRHAIHPSFHTAIASN